jgi:nitrogen fixation NifU-like protein
MKDAFDTYTEKVIKHFQDPKNIGVIKDADGIGTVGNPKCGDVMKVYIKIAKRKAKNAKKEEYIKDIKVQTLGCAAAIATSSVITELAKGKSIKEAMNLTNKDVVDDLGGLPPVKHHCSLLAEQGIKAAVSNYLNKTGNTTKLEIKSCKKKK